MKITLQHYQMLHRMGLLETFCFLNFDMKGYVFRHYDSSRHLFLTMENL